MNLTDRLRHWGATQAQARSAERAAGAQGHAGMLEARRLRQEADRLHREIYGSLGRPGRAGPVRS